MKCTEVTELFPDYLAGTLDEALRDEMQAHFLSCDACRHEAESLGAMWQKLGELPEAEPGAAMRARFYTALAAYQHEIRRSNATPGLRATFNAWLGQLLPRQPAYQFALVLLLAGCGFFLGQRFHADNSSKQEITQLRQEIHGMRQLVTLSLLQQQSPSERLRGVSWSTEVGQPNQEILSALLETMDYDPNVNVRLAAVDALSRFSDHEIVREGLIQSLTRQRSPLIQIALIDLMVEQQERQAVEVLKKLDQDTMVNQAVRQRIEWGIQQLQYEEKP